MKKGTIVNAMLILITGLICLTIAQVESEQALLLIAWLQWRP